MNKKNRESLKYDYEVGIYFIKLTHQLSKSYLPFIILTSFFKVIQPLFNIVMLKNMIDELAGSKSIHTLIILSIIFSSVNLFLGISIKILEKHKKIANIAFVNRLELHTGKHIMNMKFESLEDAHILDMKETALHTIYNQEALENMIKSISTMIQSVVSLLALFSMLLFFDAYILIMIVLLSVVSAKFFERLQKEELEMTGVVAPLNRSFVYYYQTTMDFAQAKDIRLYNILPLVMSKLKEQQDLFYKVLTPIRLNKGKFLGLINLNFNFQMIIVYFYVSYKVFQNKLSIGQFTLLISAANQISNNIYDLITSISLFRQSCRYLDLFLQFERLPTQQKEETKKEEAKRPEGPDFCIEFKNVFFKYANQHDYALKNVSILINSGEKLSVVGRNGAGKTTFIKLICRLYEPESGEILLNGQNINEYDFNEYIKLLSVVFQDYRLFPYTIRENVVMSGVYDGSDEPVISALKQVGVYDKIEQLKGNIDTDIYKIFSEGSIDFSGGESQKIAIARAVFRDSSIMILDEPTSALDSYAESDIYEKFHEMTRDHTAIYISHRLSSCMFCDRIAVFQNGEIIEYGTHTQLCKIENGEYHKMWNLQSQYYI